MPGTILVGLLAILASLPTSAASPIVTRLVVPGGTANTAVIAPGGTVVFEVRIDAPAVTTIGASYRLAKTFPYLGDFFYNYFSITGRSLSGSPFNDPARGASDAAVTAYPANLLEPASTVNLGNNSPGLVGVAPGNNLLVGTITLTSSPYTPTGTYRFQPVAGVSFATEITTDIRGNDVAMSDAYFDVVVATGPAPGAPRNVTAVAGDAQASVGFTAPANVGGNAIIGYTATCTPTGDLPVRASGTGNPIVVRGLTNGVIYTCTVHATNGAGDGPESLPSNSVTPSPAPPAELSVSLAGSGTGTVVSIPTGIVCPGDCAETYPAGTGVVLTAAATGASVFTGWLGGGCTGASATCTATFNTPTTVTSTFAAPGIMTTLNIDSSSSKTKYDALTDGLLIIRYLFGFTGNALTTGALDATATLTDPALIKGHLDDIRPLLDIDGNGSVDALTDGLLILRYLFGLRGDALIAGVVDPVATRKNAPDIEAYLQTLMP